MQMQVLFLLPLLLVLHPMVAAKLLNSLSCSWVESVSAECDKSSSTLSLYSFSHSTPLPHHQRQELSYNGGIKLSSVNSDRPSRRPSPVNGNDTKLNIQGDFLLTFHLPFVTEAIYLRSGQKMKKEALFEEKQRGGKDAPRWWVDDSSVKGKYTEFTIPISGLCAVWSGPQFNCTAAVAAASVYIHRKESFYANNKTFNYLLANLLCI